MKHRAKWFCWLKWIALAAVVGGVLSGCRCRKTTPPAVTESAEKEAAETETGPGKGPIAVTADAAAAPQAPEPRPPRAAARGDVDPVRADRPALGFPVPEGMRLLRKDAYGEAYEAPYSVGSLKRFFQREMGKDVKIEPRRFGFRVVPDQGNGFVLVTRPDEGAPQVSVVRFPVNRSPDPPPATLPLGPGTELPAKEH
jgi:hypothetical protein